MGNTHSAESQKGPSCNNCNCNPDYEESCNICDPDINPFGQIPGHSESDQSDPEQSDPDQSDPDQSDPDQSDTEQSYPDQSYYQGQYGRKNSYFRDDYISQLELENKMLGKTVEKYKQLYFNIKRERLLYFNQCVVD